MFGNPLARTYDNRLTSAIKRFILGHRPPDQVIGSPDDPYLLRWWVIPRNPWFNIYFHEFRRSDDDRALHDHPWWNCSILLHGTYLEVTKGGARIRSAGTWSGISFRRPETPHRIALLYGAYGIPKVVQTLFITGPWRRSWGFHCPNGWRHWKDFVDPNNPNLRGPGCD